MLYISRHGLRLDKIDKSYRNNPNPPIHHSGIHYLIDNSKRIERLDAIFCSPFLRCVQTAHYLNKCGSPIFIEYGLSETLRDKHFKKFGYNPLDKLHKHYELKPHYYSVDCDYNTVIRQQFPESRRDSRNRAVSFMKWLKKSEYWEKDVLLVGHGFSVKDCLNFLGINPPFQGWKGSLPSMGHLFVIDNSKKNDAFR